MQANPTVFDIARLKKPTDGLNDNHIMLARGVIAEAIRAARKLPTDIAAMLMDEETLWDIWTEATMQFESHYDPARGKPSTYGHYSIRYGITRILQAQLKVKRGTPAFATTKSTHCPLCHAERPKAADGPVIKCPECGRHYAALRYRPDAEIQSIEGNAEATHNANANNSTGKRFGRFGVPRVELQVERNSAGMLTQGKDMSPRSLGALLSKEKKARIHAAIATLPPRKRRVIYARFFEDKQLREIASDEGITHQRVQQIITRELEPLKILLENL